MRPRDLSLVYYLVSVIMILLAATISIAIYNELNVRHAEKLPGEQITLQEAWSLVKPVILFGLMLLGMLFNQIFEILQTQKNRGFKTTNMWENFLMGIRGITFWMAVVVSPIIFFCSFYLVDSNPDNKASYFFAFQNGFFWYTIFNKTEMKVKKT